MSGVQQRLNKRGVSVRPTPRDAAFPIGSYDFATQPVYNKESREYNYLVMYCSLSLDNIRSYDWDYQVMLDEILRTRMMGRLKLSKALKRINKDFEINNLIKQEAQTDQFVVSTRYSDILRCSETKHFQSCFKATGCYRQIPAYYLMNPGVAIAFVRDRSGRFKSRVFLYMLEDGNIVIGRVYGDTTFLAGIKQHFPNWVQTSYSYRGDWANLKHPLDRMISYNDFGVQSSDYHWDKINIEDIRLEG